MRSNWSARSSKHTTRKTLRGCTVENNTQTHSKQHRNTCTYILEHIQKELRSHLQLPGLLREELYYSWIQVTHTHAHTYIQTWSVSYTSSLASPQPAWSKERVRTPAYSSLSRPKDWRSHQTTEPGKMRILCEGTRHSSLTDLALLVVMTTEVTDEVGHLYSLKCHKSQDRCIWISVSAPSLLLVIPSTCSLEPSPSSAWSWTYRYPAGKWG